MHFPYEAIQPRVRAAGPARLRVADHDRRAKDGQWHPDRPAVVGEGVLRVALSCLVVARKYAVPRVQDFPNAAVARAAGVGGREVNKVADARAPAELHRMHGAIDAGGVDVVLAVRLEAGRGGKVPEMIDTRLAQAVQFFFADPERAKPDIARHDGDARHQRLDVRHGVVGLAGSLEGRQQLGAAGVLVVSAHENVCAVEMAPYEADEKVASKKARRSGDERRGHFLSLP